ncbi:glycosidase [Pedobacter sp. LMG 31464]|uniref:Glycosidase n=1 Tax=Pedobacter planticolens TaxID=2679964 RepID=A0A923DYG4_9SPHI|nr:glycoside hydrolase family 130 protein [Pedobacter planticolens]MBB2144309.1 glycosidase [Pedobacter planticolens]
MRLPIERKHVKVYPDPKRVIARFFFNGDERGREVINKVMTLSDEQVFNIISPLLQEYSKRHRNITKILSRHCKKLKPLFEKMDIDYKDIETHRSLLIGSYFTHEYSIESAAFFNPSIVEDPDQSNLEEGEKRLIISFRAVGEGHISSIVFRRALIDRNNNITVIPSGNYIDEAEIIRNATYNKKLFLDKGLIALINKDVLKALEAKLGDQFDYATLKGAIAENQLLEPDPAKDVELEKVLWLSDSYHELIFSMDTDISDRVIFPISEFERKGIEDARFVKFINDDSSVTYYATYTAYDGHIIIPKLLKTKDFYDFNIGPLFGDGAQNKNLALFPRKINGKYAMLSRIDGVNNYIMYSNKINVWENPIKLQEPKYNWEFVQIGNCGSPIETEDGWLIITHAVGPMRRYCLSACLLNLEDPTIEIGRLEEPLLIPNPDEREGYVPNVVYSCGSIINNDHLIIPYGLSDYSSSFASVELKALLERLKSSPTM